MHLSSKIILICYKIITMLTAPFFVAFLCYKKRRDPPYGKQVFELLGFYPYEFDSCIWFHGASVGEINSLKPLINKFSELYPQKNLLITTMTTTGAQAARSIRAANTVFMPLDSPCAIRRFYKNFHPEILFIVDTELWPNMLQYAKKYNCRVIIINGRMQEKNCLKYEKNLKIVKDVIASALHKVICVSKEDSDRFKRIGVDSDKVIVAGNIKYDLNLSFELFNKAKDIKNQIKGQVLCCASTHEGEEGICLEVFSRIKKTIPDFKLLVVPRHKSDTEALLKELKKTSFKYICKSTITSNDNFQNNDVIIGDTMGEMSFYFGLSDLVFMGGSFVNIGGHNPLEPAFYALPVLTGPDFHNFKEQFERLIKDGGAFAVKDTEQFEKTCISLLNNQEKLDYAGKKALQILKLGRGSTIKILNEVKKDVK